MIRASKKYIYCFTCILSSLISFSQVRYSTDPFYITSKPAFNTSLYSYQSAYPDTSISRVHNYAPRNFLGNLGLPSPQYLFRYEKTTPLGFKIYDLPYYNDIITPQQIEYFQTKGPYASLTGNSGSKNEQMFKMLFSYTLKKKFNVSLKFNRYNSAGFYQKQQTSVNNFYINTNYHTDNNRFGFFTYLLVNRNKNQENGGIKFDTLFTKDPSITKALLPVSLGDARRDARQISAAVNPWLRLDKGNDSSGFGHYIDYKFSYTGSYTQYIDKGVASDFFYDTTYNSPYLTNDSAHLRQLIHRANYTLKHFKSGLGASIGYSHEYNLYHQGYGNDSTMTNQQLHATLFFSKLFPKKDSTSINRHKKIFSVLTYDKIFKGTNLGDERLEWSTTALFRLNEKGLPTRKTNMINMNVFSELRHPDMIYNYWRTNNFQWTNNFKLVNFFQFKMGVTNVLTGLSANILWKNVYNYLYFDSAGHAAQAKPIISNWQYNLNFDKVLFRHLGIRANVYYQTTNGKKYIKMPPLAAMGSLYYTGNLFKNNLNVQVGVQGDWYQQFEAYRYMPATNNFYIQDNVKVGGYPFLDVFLSGRIRPVQFFVKVENVLQGLTGSNYYFVPGYIQPDRAFRFGLTWLFFD